MDSPVSEPIDLFVHELQVIGPKHFSHEEIHFHVSKTANDVSLSLRDTKDNYLNLNKGYEEMLRGKQGGGQVLGKSI